MSVRIQRQTGLQSSIRRFIHTLLIYLVYTFFLLFPFAIVQRGQATEKVWYRFDTLRKERNWTWRVSVQSVTRSTNSWTRPTHYTTRCRCFKGSLRPKTGPDTRSEFPWGRSETSVSWQPMHSLMHLYWGRMMGSRCQAQIPVTT